MIDTHPLPVTDDPLDAPFWRAARRGELQVQYCSRCQRPRFPPRARCSECQSGEGQWRVLSGRGQLWSFVVPYPPLLPALERELPYAVGLASLAEHPELRMVGRLTAVPDTPEATLLKQALAGRRCLIDHPVHVEFVMHEDDVHLPYWRLSGVLDSK